MSVPEDLMPAEIREPDTRPVLERKRDRGE